MHKYTKLNLQKMYTNFELEIEILRDKYRAKKLFISYYLACKNDKMI